VTPSTRSFTTASWRGIGEGAVSETELSPKKGERIEEAVHYACDAATTVLHYARLAPSGRRVEMREMVNGYLLDRALRHRRLEA
jgi:hypothetical protein